VHRTARSDEELATLERDIADVGYYSFGTTGEEAERLSHDEGGRDEQLHRLMNERVQASLELATDRMVDSQTPLYLIPGNDDEFVIDDILNRDAYKPVNVDGKVLDIATDLQLLASGWSNHTTAPLLDENLRPTVSAGDVLRGPVGSTAVRRLIERYEPLLTIHGHIHESGGERKIGKTLCINPGSEANHGVLRG
jgi:Icc-related predicted phosphoesterase